MPPPVPVTVIVCDPVAALRFTVIVMVEVPEPGAAIELGLKLTLTREGTPLAESATAELNPPEIVVVIWEVPELPRATLTDVGEAEIAKFGLVPVTVNETVVLPLVLPEVPVTVIAYVPGAVEDATVIVMVEVPAPVIEVGLKPTVTPDGCPLADKAIAEENPPVTVLVIVDVPELPCATVTEAGEAERLKPAEAPPASAVMSPDPFGLPQPVARSYPVVAESPLLPLMMS